MTQAATSSPPVKGGKTSFLRVLAAIAMLAIAVCFMLLTVSGEKKAATDFICYWSAGVQLVHHQNPYDFKRIQRLEDGAANSRPTRPRFMRNGPNAFFIAYPLGFLRERPAAIMWSLSIIAALMISIRLLCKMLGNPQDGIHLIGYCFPPVLACLLEGQIAIFIMLGVVLFLYLYRQRPEIAGMALLLCTLKPHLFLPLGVVLIAWIFTCRVYRVLAGTMLALACSCAFSFYLDPQGWSHYATMMRTEQIQNEFIPTVSLMFRLILNRHLIWLQFVPATIACVWALWYFWRNRGSWDWLRHGTLLLVVSVLVAPYAWFTDEAVVLPAILVGLIQTAKNRRSYVPFGVIAGMAFLEVMMTIPSNLGYYIWTAPAWLIWYVFVTRPVVPTAVSVEA